MDGPDLISGKVPVTSSLQSEADTSVVGIETKLVGSAAPKQLLSRELVVPTLLDNVLECLQEVQTLVSDLGLWVELGAALGVKLSELVDELLIFGGAVDGVVCDRLLRRHGGRLWHSSPR